MCFWYQVQNVFYFSFINQQHFIITYLFASSRSSLSCSHHGWPNWIICFYLTLFSVRATICMPSSTAPVKLLCGLLLFFLSDTSIVNSPCAVYSLSLFCACPNHFTLVSLSPKDSSWGVSQIYSLLMLSILITKILATLPRPALPLVFLSLYCIFR